MKVLVVPDIHLKQKMFDQASDIFHKLKLDNIVLIGDIVDDWNQQYNLGLYEQTLDRAVEFAKEFPNSLWCYGNHDVSYLWGYQESGFSHFIYDTNLVGRKLNEIKSLLTSEEQYSFIHKIDNVLFMHGGLCNYFVHKFVPKELSGNIIDVIQFINNMIPLWLWTDSSPIWLRPQYENYNGKRHKMFKEDEYIQVVGHTPVTNIIKIGNFISCDTFSTYSDGSKYGNEEFLVIDTITKEYEIIK